MSNKIRMDLESTDRRLAMRQMKQIFVHFRGLLDENLRPLGVTTAQLSLLYAIQKLPKSSGAQLARGCYITPQTAQALIQRAEESGWIVRSKDSVNDRILTATLTAAGERLLKKAAHTVDAVEDRLWQGIPASSIAALNAMLAQCLENIEVN